MDPLFAGPLGIGTCQTRAIPPPASAQARPPIGVKDTSHRLLQTDYLERAPNRIGDLPVQTSHARLSPYAAVTACFSAPPCRPICLGLPADRSPSRLPRAGARLTTRF